jgi:hypothetical protein
LHDYLLPDGNISGASLPEEGQVPITNKKVYLSGPIGFVKNIMKEFRVFVVPYEAFRAMQTRRRSDNRDPLVSEDDVEMTKIYLDKMRNFAKENGAEFIVVIFPKESQLQRTYIKGGRVQDQLIAVLDGLKIPYVDLYDPVKDAIKSAPKEHWYYDELHPYKIGHKFIGEYLANDFSVRYPEVLAQ